MKMIGYSLSFCVKDICRGVVSIDDVERIEAGTAAATAEDWLAVVDGYVQTYWQEFPEHAMIVVARLLETNRIYQPRLNGELAPSIANGWWKLA